MEAAVRSLEDNPLFNAGRGSAINARGEVEMCASIMDGKTLNSGAVAIVRNVRNPVSLAKAIMTNTDHIYLGAEGALDYAKQTNIDLVPDAYFITPHQYDDFDKARRDQYQTLQPVALEQIGAENTSRMHGTVGAVALDMDGHLAAATSTGGTPNCMQGRIGDSSMTGVGSYADDKTCAVSSTGDGEYLIRAVICHSVSQHMTYTGSTVDEACKKVVHEDNAGVKGDIGIIGVDRHGNVAAEFNSQRLLRAWKKGNHATVAKIY